MTSVRKVEKEIEANHFYVDPKIPAVFSLHASEHVLSSTMPAVLLHSILYFVSPHGLAEGALDEMSQLANYTY